MAKPNLSLFWQLLPISRGGLRRFFERTVFPPASESAQRQAGEASAQLAVQEDSPETLYDPAIGIDYDAAIDIDIDEGTSAPHKATSSSTDSATELEKDGSPAPESSRLSPPTIPTLSSPPSSNFSPDLDINDEQLHAGFATVDGASRAAGGSNLLNEPHPDIPQEEGAAAFFDVDNTLIQGASILLLARGLAKRHFFSAQEIIDFLWKQAKFRIVGRESATDIAAGREQALSLVKGQKAADLEKLIQEIWESSIAHRTWPGTKHLADMHMQAGQQVWLVTAAPVQLAQTIARSLGFTGALGTVAEVDDDGYFTGRLVGDILHGPGKKHAVAVLAALEGLDLQKCTAYSDSVNDLPMLSMVGTAVAINPDRQLRQAAKIYGWDIREYRYVRRAITYYLPLGFIGVSSLIGLGWLITKQGLLRKG